MADDNVAPAPRALSSASERFCETCLSTADQGDMVPCHRQCGAAVHVYCTLEDLDSDGDCRWLCEACEGEQGKERLAGRVGNSGEDGAREGRQNSGARWDEFGSDDTEDAGDDTDRKGGTRKRRRKRAARPSKETRDAKEAAYSSDELPVATLRRHRSALGGAENGANSSQRNSRGYNKWGQHGNPNTQGNSSERRKRQRKKRIQHNREKLELNRKHLKGVSIQYENRRKPFQATANGKFLGSFATEEEAARAYDAAIEQIDITRTNVSEGLLPPLKRKKAASRADADSCQPVEQKRYLGVSRVKKNKVSPWGASMYSEGKNINLGCYATEEDAARAYDEKVIELRGPQARTNVSLGLLPPLPPDYVQGSALAKRSKLKKSSKYVGVIDVWVHHRPKRKVPAKPRYRAYLEHGKRSYNIGRFRTAEAAARAYDRKLLELRGPNAKTNVSRGLLPPLTD